MKHFFFLILISVSLFSCNTRNWYQTGNGIDVFLDSKNDTGAVRLSLNVISPEIINVKASPSGGYTQVMSLAVTGSPVMGTPFQVNQEDDDVILSTSEISARVSVKTGRIIFTDKDGTLLLGEPENGGKSFSPLTVGSSDGYRMRQVFNSPSDEAFYGLGSISRMSSITKTGMRCFISIIQRYLCPSSFRTGITGCCGIIIPSQNSAIRANIHSLIYSGCMTGVERRED